MNREEERFLLALEKRREQLMEDLIKRPVDSFEKYREHCARHAEVERIEAEARKIFQGED